MLHPRYIHLLFFCLWWSKKGKDCSPGWAGCTYSLRTSKKWVRSVRCVERWSPRGKRELCPLVAAEWEREREIMGCAADNRWTQAFLLFPFWVSTRDGSAHRQSEGNRWEQEWTSAKSRPLVALSQILAIMLSWLIYVMRVVPRYLFFLLCETGNRDGNHHKTRFGTVFLTCATQRLQPPPKRN